MDNSNGFVGDSVENGDAKSSQEESSVPFTRAEMIILINLYSENKTLLEQHHCPAVTESKKSETWERICDKVNSCGGAGGKRTVKQLKKKMCDIKANTRNWANSVKNPPSKSRKWRKKLWYYDIVIDNILGRDSPILHGVEGGFDSAHQGLFGVDRRSENCETNMIDAVEDDGLEQEDDMVYNDIDSVTETSLTQDFGDNSAEELTDPGESIIVIKVETEEDHTNAADGNMVYSQPESTTTEGAPAAPNSTTPSTTTTTTAIISVPATSTQAPAAAASTSTGGQNKESPFFTTPDESATPLANGQKRKLTEISSTSSSSSSSRRLSEEHTQQVLPNHPPNRHKKRKYDHLVDLEIHKTKLQLEEIARARKEKEGGSEASVAVIAKKQELVALQRQRVQLKRERALFALEVQRETELGPLRIESEKLKLAAEKELAQVRVEREKVELAAEKELAQVRVEREKVELAREKELAQVRVEREKVELAREKEKLKQDQIQVHKAQLELMRVQQAMNIHSDSVSESKECEI